MVRRNWECDEDSMALKYPGAKTLAILLATAAVATAGFGVTTADAQARQEQSREERRAEREKRRAQKRAEAKAKHEEANQRRQAAKLRQEEKYRRFPDPNRPTGPLVPSPVQRDRPGIIYAPGEEPDDLQTPAKK